MLEEKMLLTADIPRCSVGLRRGLCAGHSSSSTQITSNHVFMDLALGTDHNYIGAEKGLSQTTATRIEAHNGPKLYH